MALSEFRYSYGVIFQISLQDRNTSIPYPVKLSLMPSSVSSPMSINSVVWNNAQISCQIATCTLLSRQADSNHVAFDTNKH